MKDSKTRTVVYAGCFKQVVTGFDIFHLRTATYGRFNVNGINVASPRGSGSINEFSLRMQQSLTVFLLRMNLECSRILVFRKDRDMGIHCRVGHRYGACPNHMGDLLDFPFPGIFAGKAGHFQIGNAGEYLLLRHHMIGQNVFLSRQPFGKSLFLQCRCIAIQKRMKPATPTV